jgi:serine/threonine-protein kinase
MTTGSPNAARLAGLTTSLAGRYRLERELGAGGMATVWLAEDLRHERRVAIKVLHPELSAVLGPERFLVEIKTTASLQHPHILPLFDSGSADGLLYYVMPYVEGRRFAAGWTASVSCRSPTRCASRLRWRTRSSTRTRAAWCTAT